jgi:CHAT domain-containing protein
VATSLNNLAVLLQAQGQYAAAEPLYRRSLAVREKALGPDHPDVASSLSNLAELLRSKGQYTTAEPLYRRSLAMREKALGPDHPDVAMSLNNLAALLKDQGQYAAASTIAAVPLGPAAVIDALVHKGLSASAQNQSDSQAHWAQLSHLVLKPLLPNLSGSRQWFLSPDGELNRVPFAALPAPQQLGLPLAQAVQLRLLTTGRELVRLQQPPPSGSAPLVMANPNYNRPGATPVPTARSVSVATGPQRRSAELGSSQWAPLPASEREGQQVASLLATRLISDTAATTTALQRQPGPRVLHIATHGFFVADQESTPTDPLRVIQEGSPLLRSLRQEDPQLRSGLVLAGANQPSLDPNDDGYLTAAEALSLKLKGTELVVLSACSTGQGESRTGEGVYGLQRSLTVAGARSTLLSLWKVDDAATADFMTRYYSRIKTKEGRAEALAAVQAEFRNGTAGNGQWKEPYYWAAWQLVGDWRPVQGV